MGSFETICRLTAAQVGISIVPESAARRYAKALPIKIMALEDKWSLRRLNICVRNPLELPSFARELVELLVQRPAAPESNSTSA